MLEIAACQSAGSLGNLSRVGSDALDRRRKLMEAWADYCLGSKNLLRLVAGQKKDAPT